MTISIAEILKPEVINQRVSTILEQQKVNNAFWLDQFPAEKHEIPVPMDTVPKQRPLTKADLEEIEAKLDDSPYDESYRDEAESLLIEVWRLRRILAKKRKRAT